MKILQLIPNIAGGGAERLVVDLCNELSINYEATLLTLYDPREKDLFRGELSKSVRTCSIGKKPGFDWQVVPKLYKAIRQIQPDIIHNHLRSLNYLMPILPLLKKIPVVHTVHNDAFKECPDSRLRKLRKFLFKNKYVIPVTISKESTNSFIKAYGDIDFALVYNGRKFPQKSENFDQALKEIDSYKHNPETKVFMNIGRLESQKNHLMLVKAFNCLIYKEKTNAILIIIGGGRDSKESRKIQQQLRQMAQKHKHIYILGERPNATDYLHAADFFCLSSLYEGMPITLIEALATGCIPVCTPVGGVAEIVYELEGSLLSKSKDADDYYQLLKNIASVSVEQQLGFKKKAVQLFEEQYSMEYCSEQYSHLYNKILCI